MITVHHLNRSRSHRVLWLLEELGLKYEIKLYQRDKKTLLAPPELKRIHPLGKSPVVTDDGIVLAESGAIIEYFLDKYGNGRLRPPAQSAETRKFTYFLHYAEGSLMSPLLLKLVFSVISSKPTPALIRPFGKAIAFGVGKELIGPELKKHFDFIESELAARPWFAGPEFTAADIQMSFPIEAGESHVGYRDRPHIVEFLKRIRARPAYRRALAVGGPVTFD